MILYIRTLRGRNADFIDITVAGTKGVAGKGGARGGASGAVASDTGGQGAAKQAEE